MEVHAVDSRSDDDFGSVETIAEHDTWSVQEMERRTDTVVKDTSESQDMAIWSDRETRQQTVKR